MSDDLLAMLGVTPEEERLRVRMWTRFEEAKQQIGELWLDCSASMHDLETLKRWRDGYHSQTLPVLAVLAEVHAVLRQSGAPDVLRNTAAGIVSDLETHLAVLEDGAEERFGVLNNAKVAARRRKARGSTWKRCAESRRAFIASGEEASNWVEKVAATDNLAPETIRADIKGLAQLGGKMAR